MFFENRTAKVMENLTFIIGGARFLPDFQANGERLCKKIFFSKTAKSAGKKQQ
jgi:hypothetical protein